MKIKGIRWWMVSLVAAGLIINYLARNTLSVAAPTLMKDLHITTEQYAHVVVAWQLCYAFMQPVAGFLLDTVGTKIGFAAFALAWSLACAAAAWSTARRRSPRSSRTPATPWTTSRSSAEASCWPTHLCLA